MEKYKDRVISGICVDLKPISIEDAEKVFMMRNRSRNKYFFNQQGDLTLDNQIAWLENYAKRDNDIYWCVLKKDGTFIGTMRLYDIDTEKGSCEQGSFMIAEEYAKEAPYAIEVELLSLDFVFKTLNLKTVVNSDREDNKGMNSLSRKIGFVYSGKEEKNGVLFNRYNLSIDDYKRNRKKLSNVMDYWKNRG